MEIFKANISYLVFNFLKENLHNSISLLKINEILQNESGVVDFFETEAEIQALYKELLSIETNIVAESNRIEYGDFQTNTILANNITQKLCRNIVFPNLVIEPTCGKGHFIIASLNNFETITTIIGIEIYKPYVWQTKFNILDFFLTNTNRKKPEIYIYNCNIFDFDFSTIKNNIGEKNLLIIGNLPWVTNSKLGSLNSSNIPQKSNFKKQNGIDAITGKGNFDIAEYITLMLLKEFGNCNGNMAFLVKNTVIKNLLFDQKKALLPIATIEKQNIDSKKEFNVSVDASLLFCRLHSTPEFVCSESDFYTSKEIKKFGWVESKFLSKIETNQSKISIDGVCPFEWRQGVKHDCTKVMELERSGNLFKNKLGEEFPLEDTLIYDILKSSDLKDVIAKTARKCVIITQKVVGQETDYMKEFPFTFNYLQSKKTFFENRKSIIYKGKPDFSIFGIGDYSFKPYKVAISGLYKTFHFTLVLPQNNKPIMLDDTCYFIGFEKLEYAIYTLILLNSSIATHFLQSISFPDAKRMITKDILMRIDLHKLAENFSVLKIEQELSVFNEVYNMHISIDNWTSYKKILLPTKYSPRHPILTCS